VLGSDPFGARLDTLVAGETIHNRSLVVRRYVSLEQAAGCHILFVGAGEAEKFSQAATTFDRRSVLIVGESKDFAARAGVIRFQVTQRRWRVQINVMAAADAQLTISSKLLRQAEIVRSSRRGG